MDWYDYGARFYDAALGRFHTIDPKAEVFSGQSPFVYAANNPISFIDLNGEAPTKPEEGKRQIEKHTYTYNEDGSHTITSTVTNKEVTYNDDGGFTITKSTTTTATTFSSEKTREGVKLVGETSVSTNSSQDTYKLSEDTHGGYKSYQKDESMSKTNVFGADGTKSMNMHDMTDNNLHSGFVEGAKDYLIKNGVGNTPFMGDANFNLRQGIYVGVGGLRMGLYAPQYFAGQVIGTVLKANRGVHKGRTMGLYFRNDKIEE